MKKGFFRPLVLVICFLSIPDRVFAEDIPRLKGMHFRQTGEVGRLELIFDQDGVAVSKLHIPEDKQVILEVKGVLAEDRTLRAMDTSEFSGAVVLIKAYRKPRNPKEVRVALQLRDNVRTLLKKESRKVILEIENRFGVFTQQDILSAQEYQTSLGDGNQRGIHVPKSDSLEDILENLTFSGRKKYLGKKISINVNEVAVESILRIIAEASGFNVILEETLKNRPPMTLSLTKVPWDQALDTILELNKLVAKKNGAILTIQTLEKATEDIKRELEARKLREKEEPLVTKVFPVSYGVTKDLISILKGYLTPERVKISEDPRTHSLIIKDTAEVIEKIKKIIEVLDTPTPQVLIESKIVEITEDYSKEIGLRDGLTMSYDAFGADDQTSNFAFNSASGSVLPTEAGATTGLFGLTIRNLSKLINLEFELRLLERERKAKIISSPKVVTQNKKKAVINSKTTKTYSQGTNAQTGQPTWATQEASLNLSVTPQVTNEGSINLEIDVRKEDFGATVAQGAPSDILGNNVNTNVLVDNGSTVVLGGLYEHRLDNYTQGVPFLKDLPLVGWLFKGIERPQTSKREIVIFLTPRIINQEESNLLEGSRG